MRVGFDEEAVPDYVARLKLDGRVVAVVGAGRGIGRQTCHALAQAGARVACVDKDMHYARKVADEVDGRPFRADVREEAAVAGLFDAIDRSFGRLDGVSTSLGRLTVGCSPNSMPRFSGGRSNLISSRPFTSPVSPPGEWRKAAAALSS